MFFPPFNVSDFLVAYINIPLFIVLYVGWKVYKRTKVWKPEDMDFVTVSHSSFILYHQLTSCQGIPTIEETELPEVPPRTFLEKVAAVVF